MTGKRGNGEAQSWGKHRAVMARELRGRRVAIIPDADDPGELYAQAAFATLRQVADAIAILPLPGLVHTNDHGADLSDWFDTHGGTTEKLYTLIDTALQSAPVPALLGVLLSEIEVEEIHWLWRQRIALGKITTFDGDGGVGKSLATLDIAARVAMGLAMPDGSPGLDAPAGVVLICGEDGLADTVAPRILAAGASPDALKNIRAINLVPETHVDGTVSQRLLSLVGDLSDLEATIAAMGARFVVIDPITAYLGEQVNSYKDTDVRRVLTPLALMAERHGIAVVLIRHLNRSNGAPAQHRGMGSVAFLNVARLGLLFAPNPDVDGEFLVSRYKGNIGAPPPTLGYRIEQVGAAENMPRISWLGERETTAEAALAAQSGRSLDGETRSATDEAVEWLTAYLADGPRSAKEVQDAARTDDITEKVLRSARLRICKKPEKTGMRDGWKWELDPEKMSFFDRKGIFVSDGSATPDFKPAPPKMPSTNEGRNLQAIMAPKRPITNSIGHLHADAEFMDAGDTSGSEVTPKMPSLYVVGQDREIRWSCKNDIHDFHGPWVTPNGPRQCLYCDVYGGPIRRQS